MEIWGAEYQESNALLVRSEHKAVLQKIGIRERCPVSFVGTITGNGKVKHKLLIYCVSGFLIYHNYSNIATPLEFQPLSLYQNQNYLFVLLNFDRANLNKY